MHLCLLSLEELTYLGKWPEAVWQESTVGKCNFFQQKATVCEALWHFGNDVVEFFPDAAWTVF